MNNNKTYSNKCVQTGIVRCSSQSPVNNSTNPYAFANLGTLCNEQALDNSQSSSYFLENSGAYTHLTAFLVDDPRYISDRPAIDVHQRVSKYGQLGHGKPSYLSPVSHRIVSLPETSPPCRIAQETSGRVVSMPESLNVLRLLHDNPGRYSDCMNQFNMSSASDATSCSRTSDAEQTFPSGVPQTPSPPSSPDSVMIIGNESQVPQAFLRPKSTTDNHDSEGWIPWVGSPPKPIPALHGPLSLPYARCPSGAEGTVIEGEDLTHMIWGLELSGAQAVQPKSQSASAHAYKTLSRGLPSSISSKQIGFTSHRDAVMQNLCNQDVIDLSRPEFKASSKYISGRQYFQSSSINTNPASDRQPAETDIRSKKPNIYDFVRRDSPIQLYPSSFTYLQHETDSWNAGLGIDLWRESLRNKALPTSDFVSIPAKDRDPLLVLGHPLESFGPSRIYQTPRDPPVHDTWTLDNHLRRPGIPTPPNTGSPGWSPRFSQTHFTMTSPDIHHDPSQNIHHMEVPRQHVVNTRESGFSSHKAPNQFISGLSNYRSITASTVETSDEEFRAPQYESPDILDKYSISERSCDETQLLSKYRTTQGRLSASGPTPLSPVSPDLRRNFSQQQPRSIPLARLIQRRLSSVIEEEVYAQNDSQELHKHSPYSSPSHDSNYASPKVHALEEEQGEEPRAQMRRMSAVTCSTAPSADYTKHIYKPPGRPSPRPSLGTRDISTKTRESSTTEQLDTSNSQLGENKGNNTVIRKTNPRPKKNYRRNRFTKKQEATPTSDK